MRPSLLGLIAGALASLLAAIDASAQPRRQSREISATIVNRSGASLNNLHITPADSLAWGEDRLGSDTVNDGGRKSLRIERTPVCRYDIRAIYGDGGFDVEPDVNLCATPTFTLTDRRGASPLRLVRLAARRPIGLFLVANATGTDMNKLLNGEASQIDGSTVDPEDQSVARFRHDAGCKVDLAAEFKDADAIFIKGHDVCALPVVTFKTPEKTVSVRFRNRGAYPVASLYVRPSGFEAWGSDRLGSSTLSPRDVKTVKVAPMTPCLHDVKATYNDGKDDIRNGVDLCAGGMIDIEGPELLTGKGDKKNTAATLESRESLAIAIRNESTRSIREVFVSAASSRDWGDNRVAQPLAPGGGDNFILDQADTCLFDVKAVYEGGREQRRMNQDLCRNGTVAFAGGIINLVDGGGPETGFPARFVNAGRGPVQSLYLTPSSDSHWGDDRLGSNALERRSRLDIRLPRAGGCFWDIKIGFGKDAAEERRRVNLCDEPEQKIRQRQKPGTVISTGTGFYISAEGHVVTNWHVIEGCRLVQAPRDGQPPLRLTPIQDDSDTDVAVLKADVAGTPFVRLRRAPEAPVRTGERAIVVGYPVRNKLGVVNVTEGVVSAAGRSGQDPTRLQFTAPVQPGNSGGPVLDGAGRAIGVVVARLGSLDDDQMSQNVNFGVSIAAVETLLKDAGVAAPEPAAGAEALSTPDVFELANAAVLPLDCIE
jgi:S1-C subfamily serine protease